MDQLIDIHEAAELLNTPVKTLRQWRLQGTGPRSAKIGRRVQYRRAEVEAWITQQFTSPTSAA